MTKFSQMSVHGNNLGILWNTDLNLKVKMGYEILHIQQCDVHVAGLRNALWVARNGSLTDYRLLMQIVAFYYKWCGEPWEEF